MFTKPEVSIVLEPAPGFHTGTEFALVDVGGGGVILFTCSQVSP